eukprot:m.68809 g.68809  ORF g.68809 m.68809 type:complete len:281 (-) comp12003_c0_seq1:81-923(-)
MEQFEVEDDERLLEYDDVNRIDGVVYGMETKPKARNQLLLLVAFVTFTLFAIAECLAAVFGHSLSLLADGLTMLVDSATYAFNLVAERKKKGASEVKVLQLELFSPTFSILALIGTTVYILNEAINSLTGPEAVCNDTLTRNMSTTVGSTTSTSDVDDTCGDDVNIMILWIFSSINLVIDIVNIVMFYVERRRSPEKGNLNMLSALTHVAIDTLRTVSVMVAALLASVFGFDGDLADTYASIACSVLTFSSTLPLFKSIFHKWRRLQVVRRRNASHNVTL